jgi:hypothetical protein
MLVRGARQTKLLDINQTSWAYYVTQQLTRKKQIGIIVQAGTGTDPPAQEGRTPHAATLAYVTWSALVVHQFPYTHKLLLRLTLIFRIEHGRHARICLIF